MVVRDFLSRETGRRWAARLGITAGFALSAVDLALLEEETKEAGQEATIKKYLQGEERDRFVSLASSKRRLEWLGGRIAAKHAAGRLMSGFAENGPWPITVSADGQGKPFLVITQGRKAAFVPEISISHSGGRALAMAAKEACGVDLQLRTPSVLKVAARFSAAGERSLLAKCTSRATDGEVGRLTLLWSAKEAIRKMVAIRPLIGFMELELVKAASCQEGMQLDFTCSRYKALEGGQPRHIKVMALLEEDFAVAATINDLGR